MKLEANIEALILWSSAQLQTKELIRPGAFVGWEVVLEWCKLRRDGEGFTKDSCTVPQKQVAVASSSVDQPSVARPPRGKWVGLFEALEVAIAMTFMKDFLWV